MLSGGETLSFRAMVERIAAVKQLSIYFVPVPLMLAKMALKISQRLSKSRFSGISGEALRRMRQDMIFDHQEARDDFAFAPQAFLKKKNNHNELTIP